MKRSTPAKSVAAPKAAEKTTKAKAAPVAAEKAPAAKAESEPEKKPRRRSLLAAAVETVKAAVRRTTGKSKAKAKAAEATVKAPAVKAAKPADKVAPAPAPPVLKRKPAIRSTARPAARQAAVELPPILLEGDEAPAPKVAGPGGRFVLGPTAPVEDSAPASGLGELPASYGTGRLLLTARDPQWLYAHWDLTDAQLRAHNRASRDGHLIVRVFENQAGGKPVTEAKVHPESRNWFLHVGKGGAKFVAELGYYAKKGGAWVSVAHSKATLTPPDSVAGDTAVRFATIPVELSFPQMLALIKQVLQENVPLTEAIQQLRAMGYKNLPDAVSLETATWTPKQEAAMRAVVTMDEVRRVWIGSLEVTELVRREFAKGLTSMSAAQLGGPSSLNVSSLSSPFGGMPGRKGFWFNVNAELIIYGATEPDAAVTIGGRPIKLRADGTFSYRFALPDGDFNLPAIAISAAGDDTRIADLAFRRSTEYSGDVGQHPQDAALRPPKAEHVA